MNTNLFADVPLTALNINQRLLLVQLGFFTPQPFRNPPESHRLLLEELEKKAE